MIINQMLASSKDRMKTQPIMPRLKSSRKKARILMSKLHLIWSKRRKRTNREKEKPSKKERNKYNNVPSAFSNRSKLAATKISVSINTAARILTVEMN